MLFRYFENTCFVDFLYGAFYVLIVPHAITHFKKGFEMIVFLLKFCLVYFPLFVMVALVLHVLFVFVIILF